MKTSEKKKASDRAWRKANPEKAAEASRRWKAAAGEKWLKKHRDNMRAHRVGLKVGDFDRMFAAQEGTCAICQDPLDGGKKTTIDHDHKTGVVRELLCSLCNLGLGAFKDKPNVLERAAAYLKKHAEK